jgi:hypothetical protein
MSEILVIIADISCTMDKLTDAGSVKLDVLRNGLRHSIARRPDAITLVFGRSVRRIYDVDEITNTDGSTDLALAVKAACEYQPTRTVVMCDGSPDCERSAFAARRKLPGDIYTLYIGPSHAVSEIDFMRRFARHGVARVGDTEADIYKVITGEQLDHAVLSGAAPADVDLHDRSELLADHLKLRADTEALRGFAYGLTQSAMLRQAEADVTAAGSRAVAGVMGALDAGSAVAAAHRASDMDALQRMLGAGMSQPASLNASRPDANRNNTSPKGYKFKMFGE